jgi:large subunit ribosomal protein L4
MIAAALNGALSDRAREGLVFVLDQLVKGDTPSTKQAQQALAVVGTYPNYLVVLDRDDYVGWLSVRNLPEAHVIAVDQLNAYDVVTAEAIIFTKTALEIFIAGPTSGDGVTVIFTESELSEILDEIAEELTDTDDTDDSEVPVEVEVVAEAPEAEAEPEPAAPKKPAARKPRTPKTETESAPADETDKEEAK